MAFVSHLVDLDARLSCG